MRQFSMDIMGEVVRFHRKRSGLSQLALAELAGIGKTAVFDIEKGKATIRMDSLLPVLKVLNINIELRSPLMQEWIGGVREGIDEAPAEAPDEVLGEEEMSLTELTEGGRGAGIQL